MLHVYIKLKHTCVCITMCLQKFRVVCDKSRSMVLDRDQHHSWSPHPFDENYLHLNRYLPLPPTYLIFWAFSTTRDVIIIVQKRQNLFGCEWILTVNHLFTLVSRAFKGKLLENGLKFERNALVWHNIYQNNQNILVNIMWIHTGLKAMSYEAIFLATWNVMALHCKLQGRLPRVTPHVCN